MSKVLEKEIFTYEKEKDSLIEQASGKYVLIHKDEIIGLYESKVDAVKEGYKRFGKKPFLVKQIVEVEKPQNLITGLIKF